MNRMAAGSTKRLILRPRLLALVVLAVCVAVLAVATWLQPSRSGLGTHTQLGLPDCGFLMGTGIPCATCGLTTSVSLAVHGDLMDSFITQPAGMIIGLLVAVVCMVSGYALFSGASLRPLAAVAWQPINVALMAAILMGSWIYKIMVVRGFFG